MPAFHKAYYDTEGPLGVPMKDRQAQALEALLKTLPRERPYEPQTTVIAKSPTELLTGERADVSWISEESIDRQGDVVVAAGMDDSNFKLNPLVTMQHAYWLPPVGRSLWRRRVKDGALVGIKAKTQYPQRPDTWPADSEWPPDAAFALVQAGLLCGKSVGFLPVKARRPTDEEVTTNPAWSRVNWVIEKWLLLEYACVYLPAQQHALVESVSKGLRLSDATRQALGLPPVPTPPPTPEVIPFTPLEEIARAFQRQLDQLNLPALVQNALTEGWSRLRGRV
jgi:hypothetical protein